MSRTFTFILEFHGGTYISQYRGRYPREALKRWSVRERQRLVGAWQAGLTGQVFDALGAQQLAPLTGLLGAWCASTTVQEEFVLLNVIATGETR